MYVSVPQTEYPPPFSRDPSPFGTAGLHRLLIGLCIVALWILTLGFNWVEDETEMGRLYALSWTHQCTFAGCSTVSPLQAWVKYETGNIEYAQPLWQGTYFGLFRFTSLAALVLYLLAWIWNLHGGLYFLANWLYGFSLALFLRFWYGSVVGCGDPESSLTPVFWSVLGVWLFLAADALIRTIRHACNESTYVYTLNGYSYAPSRSMWLGFGLGLYYLFFLGITIPLVVLSIVCPPAAMGSMSQAALNERVEGDVTQPSFLVNATSWTPYTVAFLGDTNVGPATGMLFQRIRPFIDALVHVGDMDYFPNPDAWEAQLDQFFPPDFPILWVAGNHEMPRWRGYQTRLKARWARSGLDTLCTGIVGVEHHCHLPGLHVIQGTPSGSQLNFTQYLLETIAQFPQAPHFWTDPEGEWIVCAWHHNNQLFQLTTITDDVPLSVYDTCRTQGALTIAGHDHLYERTKVLQQFGPPVVSTNGLNNATHVHLKPGETIHVVSGAGGHSIYEPDPTLLAQPWWQLAIGQSSRPMIHAAALVCTFRWQGLPSQARCQEIDADGTILDEFMMYK